MRETWLEGLPELLRKFPLVSSVLSPKQPSIEEKNGLLFQSRGHQEKSLWPEVPMSRFRGKNPSDSLFFP